MVLTDTKRETQKDHGEEEISNVNRRQSQFCDKSGRPSSKVTPREGNQGQDTAEHTTVRQSKVHPF